ncbi:MAG: hypothetical protein U0746_11805 [Gemmataceae bacterium]
MPLSWQEYLNQQAANRKTGIAPSFNSRVQPNDPNQTMIGIPVQALADGPQPDHPPQAPVDAAGWSGFLNRNKSPEAFQSPGASPPPASSPRPEFGPAAPRQHILSIQNGEVKPADDYLYQGDPSGGAMSIARARTVPQGGAADSVPWQSLGDFAASKNPEPTLGSVSSKLMSLINDGILDPLVKADAYGGLARTLAADKHNTAMAEDQKRRTDLLDKQIQAKDDPKYKRDELAKSIRLTHPEWTDDQVLVELNRIEGMSNALSGDHQSGPAGGQSASPASGFAKSQERLKSVGPEAFNAIAKTTPDGKPRQVGDILAELYRLDRSNPGLMQSKGKEIMQMLNERPGGEADINSFANPSMFNVSNAIDSLGTMFGGQPSESQQARSATRAYLAANGGKPLAPAVTPYDQVLGSNPLTAWWPMLKMLRGGIVATFTPEATK